MVHKESHTRCCYLSAEPHLHLASKDLCMSLLSLRFVNVFHQDMLVLENVTLGFLLESMVSNITD